MLKYHKGEEGNSQEMEKITDLVKVIFGEKIESFLMKFDSKIAGQYAAQQDHHRQCERGQGAAEQNIRVSGPCGRHHKSLLVQEELQKRERKIENSVASFFFQFFVEYFKNFGNKN